MNFTPPSLSNSGLKFVCYVHIDTETSSLRTFKIVPRNLNEIVRLWIRLLEFMMNNEKALKNTRRV